MRLSDRVAPAPPRLWPSTASSPAQRVVRSWLRQGWLPLFVLGAETVVPLDGWR